MRTISKPTDEQLQRLMNLIALPAKMDDESVGDRFDFKDGNGEYFIEDFCDWLEKKDKALYDKVADDYSGVEYMFWPEPDGTGMVEDDDDEEGIEYRAFKWCALYIYTHKSALEGVCEELKEFSEDKEYIDEFEYWEDTWYKNANAYRKDLAKLFSDVQYGTSEAARIKGQKIFNSILPDVKERISAPVITEDELWNHLFDAFSWNENRKLTKKDFMKANPSQFINKGNGIGIMISGSAPSIDDNKVKKYFAEKFKKENPMFKQARKDLNKYNLELDAADTYVDFLFVSDHTLRNSASDNLNYAPYGFIRCGKGEGFKTNQEHYTVSISFYIFWDGEDIRAFLPEKGNAINLDTMTYIYIDHNDKDTVVNQEDIDYLTKTGYSSPKRIIEPFRVNDDEMDRQYELYVSGSQDVSDDSEEDEEQINSHSVKKNGPEADIINFNAPDAKPGRKAPEIDEYEFTKKVLELVKFNADDLPTASQFTRSNRMIGIPKSLLRDFKTKIEDAFVRQNPALKKVYADISKVGIPCENTEGSWVLCVYVDIDDVGYITMMCGSGERNHSTTLPVVFFIYWDGSAWRAFVPVKGNAINMNTRKPIALDVRCHIDTIEDKQYLEGIGFDWEQSFEDWTPEWDVLRGQLYKRIIVENEE